MRRQAVPGRRGRAERARSRWGCIGRLPEVVHAAQGRAPGARATVRPAARSLLSFRRSGARCALHGERERSGGRDVSAARAREAAALPSCGSIRPQAYTSSERSSTGSVTVVTANCDGALTTANRRCLPGADGGRTGPSLEHLHDHSRKRTDVNASTSTPRRRAAGRTATAVVTASVLVATGLLGAPAALADDPAATSSPTSTPHEPDPTPRRRRRLRRPRSPTAPLTLSVRRPPRTTATLRAPAPRVPGPSIHSQRAYDPEENFTARWTRADALQLRAMSDPEAPAGQNSMPPEYSMPAIPQDFPILTEPDGTQVWVWDTWTLTDGAAEPAQLQGLGGHLLADRRPERGLHVRRPAHARALGFFYRKADVPPEQRPENGGWIYGGLRLPRRCRRRHLRGPDLHHGHRVVGLDAADGGQQAAALLHRGRLLPGRQRHRTSSRPTRGSCRRRAGLSPTRTASG